MITLFETYLKFTGYDISRAGKELKQIQSLSPEKFLKWQNEQKWKIARYHYDNNPFYRKKLGNHFPERWEDLSIMEKSDYQDDLEDLLSKGYTRKNTYIANTSGSSGHPFFFAKNKEAHAMTWAYKKHRYKALGLSFSDLEARFYGIPLVKKGYYKEKIKDLIMRRARFPVFDLSDQVLERYYQLFLRKKFGYIYGYTNSIVMFARYILNKKYNFSKECNSIKIVIVTSEVCTKWDRSIIEEAFKVPIISEYGASEVGYMAFELSPDVWQVVKENVFFESGNNDNLIVTNLHNKALPFIRYNIGDVGELCTDKNSYQLIKNLKGRVNDIVSLPSGKTSPGLTFYYISRSILEAKGILREFIVRQTKLDTFVLDIVSDRSLSEKEKNEIQISMDRYLEPGLSFEINRVDEIHRPESGKIKHFYSELE